MRAQTMMIGLLQAALLLGCDGPPGSPEAVDNRGELMHSGKSAASRADSPALSPQEASAPASATNQWFQTIALEPTSRLIIRTGQASIEVDSLEPAMAELRRVVQRTGGFIADASIQTGRNQLRSATLELKVPAARFDQLTDELRPLGRLEFVNVGAQDVSEEFVDLTARVANGHRLEDRLVELLRTRTGKLQDVLSVERELARVREEIERMEGRLRFLKISAHLSTLSVSLHEPPPILVSHPGQSVIVEAFKSAWRNFVGLLAAAIASLGFVGPAAAIGWGMLVIGRKYKRKTA